MPELISTRFFKTIWIDFKNNNWSLPLNVTKCKVLHLGKNNPHHPYFLNNELLESVEKQCDLGVTITWDLNWSTDIENCCAKANRMLYMINKSFSNANFESYIKLHKTYVRPLLEFAGPVWTPNLVRDQSLLE